MALPSMKSDDGFGLIEVVFASAIAFFALTALFGLIVTSAGMGVSSQRVTLETALGNRLVEQARALPYQNVWVIGVTSPVASDVGSLAASETISYQGKSFQVTRTIAYADDPGNNFAGPTLYDYKKLNISLKPSTGTQGWVSFDTIIRDRAGGSYSSGSSTSTPSNPSSITVVFTQVPAQNAVIFNTSLDSGVAASVWSGPGIDDSSGTASLQAHATASGSPALIAQLMLAFDTARTLYNGHWSPQDAVWTPSVEDFTNPAFPVDSRSLDTSGVPLFLDGKHVIKATGLTGDGLQDMKTWEFYVDNAAPTWSNSTITMSGAGANDPNLAPGSAKYPVYLGFTPATDGLDYSAPTNAAIPVNSYDVGLGINGGALTTLSNKNMGTSGAYTIITGSPSGFTLAPFTAYTLKLTPRSPRGLLGPATNTSTAISSFALDSTSSHGNNSTGVLKWADPSLAALTAVGGTTPVIWEYRESASSLTGVAWTSSGTWGSGPTLSGAIWTGTTPKNKNTYFQVRGIIKNGATVKAYVYSEVKQF